MDEKYYIDVLLKPEENVDLFGNEGFVASDKFTLNVIYNSPEPIENYS